jgi:hypothetical protein
LCNTSLTQQECNQIDVIIHQAVLPRCGYNRNMATAVRYGPKQWGGAGFRKLYTEQSVSTILQALKYLRSPDGQPGQMLKVALSWVQAYIGTSTFLWEDVQQSIPPCPSSWIIGVRKALNQINGSIILPLRDDMVPTKLRENDVHIMDLVIQNGILNPKTMDQINACRRYLQATTLADLSNDQGTKIEESMVTGEFQASPNTHRVELFNQQKPSPTAWRVWKKFLASITHPQFAFRRPLRDWTVEAQNCRRYPPYVYHEHTNALYRHHKGPMYTKMISTSPGRFAIPTTPMPTSPSLDPSGYPVYVQESGDTLIMWKNYKSSRPSHLQIAHTFNIHINSLPTWERSLLETHNLAMSPTQIMQAFNQGEIVVASDGSVTNNLGTFGYVIASNTTKERLITGRGPVFGTDPSSFRAEAYGALAAIQIMYRLSQFTGIPILSPISHYIDNSSVVNRIKNAMESRIHSPNATLLPEWDVIHQLQQSIRTLDSPINFNWIRGHQDATQSRQNLQFEAQLNCEADDECAAFQWSNQDQHQIIPSFPTTHAHLTLNHHTITSKYKAIREASTTPQLMQ